MRRLAVTHTPVKDHQLTLMFKIHKEQIIIITATKNESQRLGETCCHSNSSEGPSANTNVKKSKRVNNNKDNLQIEIALESEIYVDTCCNWFSWYSHRMINTGTGGLGNKGTSEEHPNNREGPEY